MKLRSLVPSLQRSTIGALSIALVLSILTSPLTGVYAAKEGKTPAGSTASATAAIDNMPRLGVEAFSVSNNVALTAVKESGAQIVRIELSWATMEPVNVEPALFNWTAYDRTFSRLGTNNLATLAVVKDCPAWACVRDNGPLHDTRAVDFAQFLGALAARYSQPPYNAHYWEIFNEPDGAGGPDNAWGWGMHGDKYAGMLSQVYPAIKAADPQSVVLLGGIAHDNFISQGGPFNPDFLGDVLDSGGGSYVDAVAFHYYKNNAHGWTNIGVKAGVIRTIMSRHGADALPLLCSEAGLSSDSEFDGSEAIQARYLVQMNVHGAASGLKAQVWFLNKDFVSPIPAWRVFATAGLTRLDNSRKPSHTAMKILADEIGSGAYLRPMAAEDGVTGSLEGHRFRSESSGRHTSVVWNNTLQEATLTIPANQAPDLSRAVSIYGEELQVTRGSDGTLQVSVGPDPVYLEWLTRFNDVPADSWMYPHIEYLATRGIIGGYGDGGFRPGSAATRGQFSKMIILGMQWPAANPDEPHFRDVPPGSTFYTHIETAFSRGIIGGYQCGGGGEPCPGIYFRPGNNITRGQIAKIIVLAKGWVVLDPPVATFSDVERRSTFYGYVETAVAHGIAGGYSDGTFRPGNNATRGQLSKMLALGLQQP